MGNEVDDLLQNLAPADQVEDDLEALRQDEVEMERAANIAKEAAVLLGDADTFPRESVLIRDSWKIRLIDIRRFESRDKGANVMLFMKDGTSIEVTRAEAALLGI